MLESNCGLPFTAVAYATRSFERFRQSDGVRCKLFVDENSYFSTSDVKRFHTWIHCPSARLLQYVSHYLSSK